jgi:tRNA(Ile)-lysidine synthase
MSRHSLLDHIRRQMPANGAIAVACSGGMDSIVLAHALAHLAREDERALRLIHVDHGLHADSAQWSAHCVAFATSLNVPIVIEQATVVPRDEGLEAAARNARYEKFRQTMLDGEVIALAHHADDQAETILLKLLRGAGPEGLGGMRAMRKFGGGFLWRPLLDLPRSVLVNYAREQNLAWIDDPSNADTRLRRNFLRHEILPRLAERWPDTSVALAHSAAWTRAAADHIDADARAALSRLHGEASQLDWRGWLKLSDALRDAVLRLWLRKLGLPPPAFFHVAEIERQLRDAAPDRSPCVRWAGCEIRRYRDFIYAMLPLAADSDWEMAWDGRELRLPDGTAISLRDDATFTAPLRVRNRRGGERIKPVGHAHRRDVRLLLQESGVPPWTRIHLPLIFEGDDLIGVADIVLSDRGHALVTSARSSIVWTSTTPRAPLIPDVR